MIYVAMVLLVLGAVRLVIDACVNAEWWYQECILYGWAIAYIVTAICIRP